MLDMRKRIIVGGIVGSLVVALVVGIGSWALRSQQAPVVPVPPITTGGQTSGTGNSQGTGLTPSNGLTPPSTGLTPATPPVVPVPSVQPPVSGVDLTRAVAQSQDQELVSIAYSFSQVFGSFSNQGGFDNIERVRFLMSKNMNAWADGFITERSKTPQVSSTDLYYGITTTALSSAVVTRTSDNAVVKVQAQRKEVRGVLSNARYILEDMTISFVREEGLWKVESATWSNQRVLGGSSGASGS